MDGNAQIQVVSQDIAIYVNQTFNHYYKHWLPNIIRHLCNTKHGDSLVHQAIMQNSDPDLLRQLLFIRLHQVRSSKI